MKTNLREKIDLILEVKKQMPIKCHLMSQPSNHEFIFQQEFKIKARHHDEIIDTGFTCDLAIDDRLLKDSEPNTFEELKERLKDYPFQLTIRDYYSSYFRKNSNMLITGTCDQFIDDTLFKFIHEELTKFNVLPYAHPFINDEGLKLKNIHTRSFMEADINEFKSEIEKISSSNPSWSYGMKVFFANNIECEIPNSKILRTTSSNNPLSINITYGIIE